MHTNEKRVAMPWPQWWLLALVALNALWVTDLFVLAGGVDDLSVPGALPTALGRLTGLYGALALVLQFVLIARIPWLERRLGMDRLTMWHRWSGFWVLWLVLTHIVFITLGAAAQEHTAVIAEVGTLLFNTPDVLNAAIATGLLVAVAITSARQARRRLRYETWHLTHLCAYLALVLGFAHQSAIGRDFIGTTIGRGYWWSLYGIAGLSVLVFRFVVPVVSNLRHGLRVRTVVPESRDVVSVHIEGRNLHRIPAQAGQFFVWRFLTRGLWWQAHPYSLSAMPDGRTLRITVKALGDGSAALRHLVPGTRVLAEGPYGAFTGQRRVTGHGAVLIGGGVGITPVRALLEEFAQALQEIVVIYRVNDHRDAALLHELQTLTRQCGAQLHVVTGPATATEAHGPLLGPRHLTALVPHLPQRDVYVCGPPGMTDAVMHSLRTLGVPARQCHTERFAFAA